MKLNNVGRCVLTDTITLLFLVLIGWAMSAHYHVPPALILIQVVGVELLSQAYPLSVLASEKTSSKSKLHSRRQVITEFVIFGILAAIISYANYLFFFTRHGLSPAYIDTGHPFYIQATTLALLTIVFCEFMNTLFVRADHRKNFFKDHLWDNPKLVKAYGLSAFLVINIIYNPWLQPLFNTRSLDILDWLTVLGCTAIYTCFRQVQRHTRKHTRHAVLNLHREVHRSH